MLACQQPCIYFTHKSTYIYQSRMLCNPGGLSLPYIAQLKVLLVRITDSCTSHTPTPAEQSTANPELQPKCVAEPGWLWEELARYGRAVDELAAIAGAALEELAQKVAEAEDVRGEVQGLRGHNQRLVMLLDEAKQDNEQLKNMNDVLAARCETLQQEKLQQMDEVRASQEERNKYAMQLQQLEQELAGLQEERKMQQFEAQQRYRFDLAELRQENKILRKELYQINSKLTMTSAELQQSRSLNKISLELERKLFESQRKNQQPDEQHPCDRSQQVLYSSLKLDLDGVDLRAVREKSNQIWELSEPQETDRSFIEQYKYRNNSSRLVEMVPLAEKVEDRNVQVSQHKKFNGSEHVLFKSDTLEPEADDIRLSIESKQQQRNMMRRTTNITYDGKMTRIKYLAAVIGKEKSPVASMKSIERFKRKVLEKPQDPKFHNTTIDKKGTVITQHTMNRTASSTSIQLPK